MALVTVVIPAYNPGDLLGEALESVRNQTFRDWQVIVVDDGSAQDLSPIVARYPGVELLRQPNSGASVARNRGILHASSPLVALMDQDDLWTTTKLEHQVAALAEHPDAGLAYCDLRVSGAQVDETWLAATPENPPRELVLSGTASPGAPEALRSSLAHFGNSFVVPSTVLYRRECLAASGLMDPWMPFTGDFDLLIRVAARHDAVHVHSTDVVYRKHDDNFTGKYDVGRRELARMRDTYLAHAAATGDEELAREASRTLRRPRRMYAAQAFECARVAWRRRAYKDVGYHLARSAMFDPRELVDAARHHLPGRPSGGVR